jgi:DNA-binding Lrp family transcriptional regulator
VFALVKLSTVGRANLAGFAEKIRALPEVVECHVLIGRLLSGLSHDRILTAESSLARRKLLSIISEALK